MIYQFQSPAQYKLIRIILVWEIATSHPETNLLYAQNPTQFSLSLNNQVNAKAFNALSNQTYQWQQGNNSSKVQKY